MVLFNAAGRKFVCFAITFLLACLGLGLFAGHSAYAASPSLSVKKATVHYKATKTIKIKNVGSKKVTWFTSKKSVASITKVSKTKIRVTGKKPGKAYVKVKVGGKTYKCKITVPNYKKYKKTKKATCLKAGKAQYKCVHCKKTVIVTLPALGHKWEKSKVVAPTCKEQGYTLYVCKNDKTHTNKVDCKGTVEHSFVNGYCKWCNYSETTYRANIDASMGADENKVNLSINSVEGVAEGATAYLLMTTADNAIKQDTKEYLNNKHDAVDKVNGSKVSTIAVRNGEQVSIGRFDADGYDRAYNKYYLVDEQGSLLKGPLYVSSVTCSTQQVASDPSNKKGVYTLNSDLASDLGAGSVTFNVNFASFLFKAGDEPGEDEAVSFESNGKTFYFNKSQVNWLDTEIDTMTSKDVSVGLTIIMQDSLVEKDNSGKISSSMVYGEGDYKDGAATVAVNTSNAEGRDYWIAFMEFLGQRYSGAPENNHGAIDALIIGNEMDYSNVWNRVVSPNETISMEAYMEEVSRTMRLASLAVSKYRSDVPVCMSLTHQWAKSAKEAGIPGLSYGGKNYFAPKTMIEYLQTSSASEGDFNWGLTPHCYGASLAHSDMYVIDTLNNGSENTGASWGMNGDMNTSALLTFSNLEILQQFLEQDKMLYKGELRSVWLNESGVSSFTDSRACQDQQAGYAVASYYKCAQLDCIKAFAYYRDVDNEGEAGAGFRPGLTSLDGAKKPVYDVYKYIDTNLGKAFAGLYLPKISCYKGAKNKQEKVTFSSWQDAMKVWDTGYDWDSKWDASKNVKRQVEEESCFSITTDESVYADTDDISITASGYSSANNIEIVVYKKGDDPSGATAVCSDVLAYSGATYTIDAGRLDAGAYTAYVKLGDEVKASCSCDFKIQKYSLTTDKSVYTVGEAIDIVASGAKSNDWVGIYKKDETPGDLSDGCPASIYWQYIGDALETSFVATKAQNNGKNYRSDWATIKSLPVGSYTIYLFKNGSYEFAKSVDIEIEITQGVSLEVNKSEFSVGEPVRVRASSDGDSKTDYVGIYPKGSDVGSARSIYWYYVKDDAHEPGVEYNLQLQELTASRYGSANLPVGEYTVRLMSSGGSCLESVDIAVSEEASKSFSTDKLVYSTGDDVMVAAKGTADADWLCMFPVEDGVTVADGSAGTCSTYWAYTAKDGQENGTAFKLNDSARYQKDPTHPHEDSLTAGQWRLVLYADDGYTILYETTILVADTKKAYDLSAEGGAGTISVNSKAASGKDWIGVYKADGVLPWNPDKTKPDSLKYAYPADKDGLCSFDGLEAGTYVVALFADDGYEDLSAVLVAVS